ncbi:N-(5'-phosphoribosyl)anthranilate isomerase [Marinibacterium profundimaris]|nr:N-(5'-phosphoribosyl)anthranilate isomerase [Marinibacterium profundimaris]
MPHHLPPDLWMQRIFDAKAARQGQVVRRSLRDLERVVGRAAFEQELRRRGYHAVLNGDQVVIFCNNDPVRIWL